MDFLLVSGLNPQTKQFFAGNNDTNTNLTMHDRKSIIFLLVLVNHMLWGLITGPPNEESLIFMYSIDYTVL